jgi:hypothetical protein
MATTPGEWLPVLSKRLDDRAPRVALLRSYAAGNPPMPEMGANVRTSWLAFQRKACTNYGGLAVESLANRIVPNAIHVGGSDDNEAVVVARRVWRDNRMNIVVADAIRDALTCSVGYLVVGDDAGAAVITREAPEQFIAAPDPLKPWKARAALKVWRDIDAGFDFAYVWADGERQKFVRKSADEILGPVTLRARNSGGWEPLGEPERFAGDVPVIIMERHDGKGLFEASIPVIDRINLGKLQRLVVTAMQAFKQRGIKVPNGGLNDVDDAGNAIDYSKQFEAAPGALWELPDGIDVWESQQTDIRPLLEGEKADARDFAAVMRTPISVFIPEGANQSAEGAAAAKEGQVFQANDEIERLKPALAVALVYALRVEGVDLGGDTVEVGFQPADRVSVSERFAAAAQATGVLARRTIQSEILGMTPDQMAQDEANLAAEQLQAFALTGGPVESAASA